VAQDRLDDSAFSQQGEIRRLWCELEDDSSPVAEIESDAPVDRSLDDALEAPPYEGMSGGRKRGMRGPQRTFPAPDRLGEPGTPGIETNHEGAAEPFGGKAHAEPLRTFLP